MLFRSTLQDTRSITLGEALFHIKNEDELLDSPTPTTLCFERFEEFKKSSLRKEHYCISGTGQEIAILRTFYQLFGPEAELMLLNSIPSNYRELKDGRRNPVARKQAIAHAIFLKCPSVVKPDPAARNFTRWVKKFQPPMIHQSAREAA